MDGAHGWAFSSTTTTMEENTCLQVGSSLAGGSRGSSTTISVNPPGSVCTWMVPPCSRTMSADMARPRPVPLPAGLVVKNGVNILSTISGGMPSPLSLMRISTLSGPRLVASDSAGR